MTAVVLVSVVLVAQVGGLPKELAAIRRDRECVFARGDTCVVGDDGSGNEERECWCGRR